MKRIQLFMLVFTFAVIAVGLTFFMIILRGTSSYTITNHALSFPTLTFIAFFLVHLAVLASTWFLITRVEKNLFSIAFSSLLWENFLAYLPFAFALLSPLLLKYYLTSDDLKARLSLLAGSMVFGFILIKLFQWNRRGKLKGFLDTSLAWFSGLPPKKKLLVLFLLALIVYHLSALCLVSKGFAYSGDEPYYLMTTHSLYQDGDINLANNFKNLDYFHFYPKEFFPKLHLWAYARAGRKGRDFSLWPISQPGISVLMLPYYWLSQHFQGRTLIYILKVSLSIWAVLLGLQIYLFSEDIWKEEKVSLLLWFLYSFSTPVLFYTFHLYPELPIALFSLYIFRKVRSDKSLNLAHYIFLGFLLFLFPWFGLKYNMILWPLLLVSVYFFLKNHKAKLKIFGFLAFPVLSVGLFALYTFELYGTYYPVAIYEGVLTPEKVQAFREVAMNIPIMLRIDSFLDYFLDQRDGLLLYSPIYFFSFLGMVEAFRRSKRDLCVLLFISLPYLFNYAFFSHRQGHSPQGRILACISWIGILFIGYFIVHNRRKFYSVLFWCLSVASLIIVVLLLRNPSFLYQPTTHQFTFRGGELFVHLSNLYFYLPSLLPSFIKVNNLAYIPNYAWLAALLAFVLGYVWKKKSPISIKSPQKNFVFFSSHAVTLIGLAVIFFWLVLYPRTVLILPVKAAYSSGERVSFYNLGSFTRMKEPGEFEILLDDLSLDMIFTSWRDIQNLKIGFGSLKGEYRVKLQFFEEELFDGIVTREFRTVFHPSPSSCRYKNTNLYRLRVDLENLSDIDTAKDPFHLSIRPERKFSVTDSETFPSSSTH